MLFHTLTGELLLLEAGDSTESCREDLIRRRFLVPENFDDFTYAEQLRHILFLRQKKKTGLKDFLIFTTLDCNARCYYCYELGRARPVMSEQTARDAADFIIRSRDKDEVKLNWFGGEPLYNRAVIDVITGILRDNHISYRSSMVSNAYLFDEQTVHTAKNDWKLERIQITLDGTEETYNRSKSYIYRSGSPYQRVMRNILLLLDAGIQVQIRLNLGSNNGSDLYALCKELVQRFSGKNNLSVYPAMLHNYGNIELGDDEKRLADFYLLTSFLRDNRLLAISKAARKLALNNCFADSEQSITILPDGSLGKCEHDSEENLIGSIYKPLPDSRVWAEWKERLRTPDCARCMHEPLCTELKKCPVWSNGCTPLDRAVKDSRLEESILFAYEKKKNRDPGLDNESDAAPELC